MQISSQKPRIGIIRGGPSSLYEISLRTGKNILTNLPDEVAPVDIFISKNGIWHEGGFEKTPVRILQSVDGVINALHGTYGEDGNVQRTLDELGVPYTGSTALASAVSMNKILTKKIFEKNNIKTPLYINIEKNNFEEDNFASVDKIFRSLPFPMVIKPAKGGSSVGLSLVRDKGGIESAIRKALEHCDSVLVEEYIGGKEATCGVIEDFRSDSVYSLLPIEIVLPNEKRESVYDYEGKHGEKSYSQNAPGNFTDDEKREIEKISKMVHSALGLRHYSRSDFRVHPKRGVYCLEVNSLPDLSEKSTFIKGLEAVGSNIKEFVSHLLHKI